ncbi:hypothetical protein [Methanoregula sp.]|uniref:hypothetical protein n=1 Tax=Methanoregula sp. TaxID=2052170 RepID=UPI003D0FC035
MIMLSVCHISNLKGTGPLVLIVLCILTVLAAGCTGTGTTPQSPAVTNPLSSVTSSGSAASKLSFDPIVGVWRSPGAVYKFEISFDVNGKTEETYSSVPHVYYNGTWIPAGDNMYLVTRETGEKTLWIHDMSANTIYKQEAPSIVYSLYQGTSMSAGRSAGTAGSSAVFSGTGNMVVPFTATESGLWVFTTNYSGQSNFIVWLGDNQGNRLALLANEIGIYSGVKPQKLDAGKYYLNVTASGPWTIQASVS